jgi:hypothetical protein
MVKLPPADASSAQGAPGTSRYAPLPRDPPYARGSPAARTNAASARAWLEGLDPVTVELDASRAEMRSVKTS